MFRAVLFLSLLSSFTFISGCANQANSPAEKRAATLEMRNDVLNKLYKQKPDTKAQIANAVGYGVFSNANINLIFASFGGGYGVTHNQNTGHNTYMNMGEIGVGLGAGLKDFRIIFVFHNKAALERFITSGWAFGGQADAAAKAGDKGLAVGGEATVDNITVYQLTESGLALQATIKGTKFWANSELN